MDYCSAAHSSSLSLGLSKSPFQFSHLSVSKMLSGVLSSSLQIGWWLIVWIWRIFKISACPPGRSFADKYGGRGDLSDNLNVAPPLWWKSQLEALMISSVSEMYSTAVICLHWARDSHCVAHSFWLRWHMSKKSLTLAILRNLLSSDSFFISEEFSEFVVSDSRLTPPKITSLAWGNCLTMIFSQMDLPVVIDSPQATTSRPREKLASSSTPCGMRKNMSHVTLERSAYFECISSCWRHLLIMSGIQNVLLISIGPEW